MSVFTSLAESLRGRKQRAASDYKGLVATLVADKKVPDVASIEATLRDAGKSVEDLESDVKAAKRRNDLRAQVAQADELLKERPAIDEQIAKAKAALQKAQEVHDSSVAPLRQRIATINDAQHAASLAESELQRSTSDEFDDRSAECEHAVRQADGEFRAAQKHLATVESRLNLAQQEVPVDDEQIVLYRQQVQNAKSRLQASQEAATQAVAAQDELLREMAAS